MDQTLYQQQKVSKAILTLALPAMLGQLTTLIYNIADTFFVSLTGDPNQIAAVTLCTPILLIIMSIGSVFGTGGSSLIARLLGAKDDNKVKAVSSYCIYTMLITSLVFIVIGIVTTPTLVNILGVDADNVSFTKDYLIYIFWGTPFIMFSNGMLHTFRSVGLIRQGTIGLIMGNISNCVLDYIFISILGMGTAGAAIATSLGFGITSVYYILIMNTYTKKGHNFLPLSPKEYHPSISLTNKVLSIGVPGALITVLMSAANIILNNFIGIYGSNAVAAYGIAYKINTVAVMLSVGLSQGVGPLIGYCYGAKEKHRLQQTMNLSMIYGVVLGLIFTVVFLINKFTFVGFFLKDSELILQAGLFLGILCVSFPILGIVNMITAYFQAVGKAIPSLVITCSKNIVLFIPIVIIFNHVFGLTGIIASQPAIEYLVALIGIIMYLSDRKNIETT